MKKIIYLLLIFVVVLSAQSNIINAKNSIQKSLQQSENLIDAFYSFDPEVLNGLLETAESSKPNIIFYQGWAMGGNYQIVNRMPCVQNENKSISCSITVKDDLMKALDIAFDVTDTFHLTFKNGTLNKVTNSSNDLQVFRDAEKWVWEKYPEWVTIPCQGYFEGGATPAKCVKAMVKGYAAFAKSKDFPIKNKK